MLQKFKDQVRVMAAKINQLDQYLNLTVNPANPTTQQEIFKVKRNIISDITHLLKDTKPLSNKKLLYFQILKIKFFGRNFFKLHFYRLP